MAVRVHEEWVLTVRDCCKAYTVRVPVGTRLTGRRAGLVGDLVAEDIIRLHRHNGPLGVVAHIEVV
jgi:hypothetical protein